MPSAQTQVAATATSAWTLDGTTAGSVLTPNQWVAVVVAFEPTVTASRTYTIGAAAVGVRNQSGYSITTGDHHGTGTTVINPDGTATTRRYTPYGTERGGVGPWPNNHGFLNQPTDTTGLSYLTNRYYDPLTATFTSVDPLVAQTRQPYIYGNGNPSTFSDPTGLKGCLTCERSDHDALRGEASPPPDSQQSPATMTLDDVADGLDSGELKFMTLRQHIDGTYPLWKVKYNSSRVLVSADIVDSQVLASIEEAMPAPISVDFQRTMQIMLLTDARAELAVATPAGDWNEASGDWERTLQPVADYTGSFLLVVDTNGWSTGLAVPTGPKKADPQPQPIAVGPALQSGQTSTYGVIPLGDVEAWDLSEHISPAHHQPALPYPGEPTASYANEIVISPNRLYIGSVPHSCDLTQSC